MSHTIAENLTRLINAKTAIGNAIAAKGGTVNSGDGLEEFATDIGTIPSGGGSADISDVNFYDYDGTVVYSYTASEFAALTAMPDNPSHEGLTAQGWNWTLANAKTYVASYGKLNIGQMYNTSDGKTRIYITLGDGRLEPYLGLGINGSVDVDWGDGSAHDTMTGSRTSTAVFKSHKYAEAGDYVIALAVTGSISFLYDSSKGALLLTANKLSNSLNSPYRNAIHSINIGSSVTSIGGAVFNNCSSLTSVTIPSSVTSIGGNAFNICYSLTSVTIPSSVTSIGSNVFQSCYSLTSVTIPSSVTSIGGAVFNNCSSLTSVTIPSSVTSIGDNAFNNCYGLGYIKFNRTTPATESSSSAWANVPTDCIIYIPLDTYTAYTTATNYPSSSTYNYVEYAIYASGTILPSTNTGGTRAYTWYATIEDWLAQTNPITVGNGKEIYCRSAAV